MTFTVEEENLICIYKSSTRTALIDDINAAFPTFEESEMREIAESVLQKLDTMNDIEFSEYDFTPTENNENDLEE